MLFGQMILNGVLVLSEATVQSPNQCRCCDFNPDFFLNEEFLLLWTGTCITHVSSEMSIAHIWTAAAWLRQMKTLKRMPYKLTSTWVEPMKWRTILCVSWGPAHKRWHHTRVGKRDQKWNELLMPSGKSSLAYLSPLAITSTLDRRCSCANVFSHPSPR